MKQETLEKFAGETGNNFKQTEIGLIPEDWEVVRLGDYLELIKNGVTKKQNKKGIGLPVTRIETISEGVIDVTKVGYINSLTPKEIEKYSLKIGDILFSHINSEPHLGKSAIYTGNPPTLIHGMNLLLIRAKKEQLDPFFLNNLFNWYRLRGIFIGIASRAVNQSSINQGKMKNLLIPLLPLPEQRKIARVLDKIQQAIELQDRIIEQAKNLKKSLMQKLFTEGLYGEEQKETEIGLIPKSRKVVRLGDIVTKTRQRDPKRMPYLKFKYVDVSSISNELYKIIEFREFLGKNAPSRARKEIKTGDIIFATVRPYLKRIAIVPQELDGELCSTAFCVLRCNKNFADHVFVFNYLLTDNFVERVSASQRGSSYPAVTDKDVLNQKIPLPPLSEQKQIAHILSVLDKKIEVEQKRKQVLKELFKTMLHKLMSGKIRLKEVEI